MDTLELMRRVDGVRRLVAYLADGASSPENADSAPGLRAVTDYFNRLAPDMELVPQRGETLGERLDNQFDQAFSGGGRRVVLMDSDSPNLPVDYDSQAFELLGETDVVLGPTRDGGFKSRPLTDSMVEFEDLVVLSGNFMSVSKSGSGAVHQLA